MRLQQVVALGHGQAHHAQAQHERDAERQELAVRIGQVGQRQAQQEAHQQADEQADDGRHELARGQLLHAAAAASAPARP